MQNPSLPNAQTTRATGIVLIIATLLSVVAMAHHPAVTAPDITQAIQQLRELADLSTWVHGILIALMLVIYWCLTEFSLRRGVERPLVRAGLVFYGAGVMAMIGAAAISGFITARIPDLAPQVSDPDLHVAAQLINLCGLLNRTLANIGAVAMSAGILAWSIGLLHSAGWPRLVGGLGVLVGLAPALMLIFGGLHLNVHGMMMVVMVQGLWGVGIGVLMITEHVSD
jgi:hypothetical protein